MEGSKNSDTCLLCACREVSEVWGEMVTGELPRQHQLSPLDPIFGVVVPWRTELDVLCSRVVKEYLLQTFIELLGKGCNILRGIELGFSQSF